MKDKTRTTQGNSAEQEENLGGTTNLSLEQLQASGDNNDQAVYDLNDLNEIRAADDLDEPDPEENYPPTGAAPERAANEAGDKNV
jgi:hypothetical protein